VTESMATRVDTLQKQILAQQALLQTLQDRMSSPPPPPTGAEAGVAAVARPAGTGEIPPPAGTDNAGGAQDGRAGPADGDTPGGTAQPAPAAGGAGAPSPDVRTPADGAPSAPGEGGGQGRGAFHLPDGTAMNTQQRMAYASGVSVWREIENSMNAQRSLGINLDPQYVMLGLKDMATRSPLKMSRDAIDTVTLTLNQLYMEKSREVRDLQKKQGSAYRVAFSKQKGAKSDAGSWYQVLSRGAGKALRTTDVVNMLVTGTLPDGTVFDASGQDGQVKTAKVGALLPAVAIGLQKIAPGGHIKVVVPPEKGYGDAGLPPAIPGGATLIFDIEVQGLAEGGAR
ncbi:FKBP-type peptidyl-prolyl cis-trans isomerase, partial [Enterobacter cloacae]|nr:FKBP-type peptidyl-prolyl cis-trans isomerase [Enterobacter cloacae]